MPEAPAETEGSGSRLSRADAPPRHRGAVQRLTCCSCWRGALPSGRQHQGWAGSSSDHPRRRKEAGAAKETGLEACQPLPGTLTWDYHPGEGGDTLGDTQASSHHSPRPLATPVRLLTEEPSLMAGWG